jgi:predicted enzyme related to lactoylglutathione lyase
MPSVPDPFEALRTAPTPIDPDPAFAARLRARVARALHPSDQGDLSMTLQTSETQQQQDQMRQGDMSYVALWVPDVERAARFYADVLGWHYGQSGPGPNRQVEGQSMSYGLSQVAGASEFLSRLGLTLTHAPAPTGYTVFVVDDISAGVQRVRDAGGLAGDIKQQPYGLVAACEDDQGLVFSLHQVPTGMPAPRPPATGARQGDVAYLVFEVPDATRARTFFSAVFGIRFEPGRTADGWNLPDITPMSGVAGGAARPTVVPMFRVDDIFAAAERVRAAGGNASEPAHEGYGTRAQCTDDQGVRFYLGQL